jgi:thiosulfate/3-mercaptopyruvate sulfurtransferase
MSIRHLIVACIAPLYTGLALAATPTIVDTTFVAEAAKRGAILWDVRSDFEYRRGHLPGAVNIDDAGWVLRNPNTEDFLPTPQIERLLGGAGIDLQREIVVYSTRGNPGAYFALYALQHFGASNARVYHDGIDGWRAAGQPVVLDEGRLVPVTLKLAPTPGTAASTAEVVAALRRPEVQLVDVRTPQEFSGDDIRAIRGGHIPGAVNIPYEQNWADPDTPLKLARRQVPDNRGMSLKSTEGLRGLYAALDRNKETIVYCQSGVRAAQTATVLSELGFRNVRVYDSSWLGYAATLSAPAANEVFFNVGALQGQLRAVQARIEQLERELAQARARK